MDDNNPMTTLFCTPMLAMATPAGGATLASIQPEFWTHEVKWDGIRTFVQVSDGETHLFAARSGNDITTKFPEVVAAVQANPMLGKGRWVMDGELIAFDNSGHVSFTAVNRKLASGRGPDAAFVGFDLLLANGVEIREHPLSHRAGMLETLLLEHSDPRLSITYRSDDRELLLHRTRELHLEGVVSKLITSPYQPGRRSHYWVKRRHLISVSCIVTGAIPLSNGEPGVGALELGMLNEDGELVSVGKVGTGFTLVERLALTRLPPDSVVEVHCSARTEYDTHRLRFPSFRGIRSDLTPQDCTINQLSEGEPA